MLEIKDAAMIQLVVGNMFAFVAALPARYAGRRTIMWVGHLVICSCHGAIALSYYYRSYETMFTMLIAFLVSFNLGVGNITFVYFSELCVDQAMGLIIACLFLTNFSMSFTISFMLESALSVEGTFAIYAALNLLATVFILVFAKETKDKTPQELFELYLPVRKHNKVELEMVVEAGEQ